MGRNLQQREATADTFVKTLKPAKLKILCRLQKLMAREHAGSDLRWHYEAGLLIKALHEGAAGYNKKWSGQLADALSTSRDLLYRKLKFVNAYDEKGLALLIKQKLSWNVVRILTEIKEDEREEVQNLVFDKGWSLRTLRAELHRRKGFGRCPVPKEFKIRDLGAEGNLRQLLKLSGQWLETCKELWWREDGFSLPSELGRLSVAERPGLLTEQVGEAASLLKRLAAKLGKLQSELKQLKAQLVQERQGD